MSEKEILPDLPMHPEDEEGRQVLFAQKNNEMDIEKDGGGKNDSCDKCGGCMRCTLCGYDTKPC